MFYIHVLFVASLSYSVSLRIFGERDSVNEKNEERRELAPRARRSSISETNRKPVKMLI